MVACSQQDDFCTMDIQETIRHHDQATIRLACMCGNDGFEFRHVMNRRGNRFQC